MIHNRTVKEVRRYDIFKLVVLLVLLLLLIFMVWRDEEDLSGVATGGEESAYPASDESTESAGDEATQPGDEAEVPPPGDEPAPADEEAYPPAGDEEAYPGGEAPPPPEQESPYPGEGETVDQPAPSDSPGYPGAEEESEPPAGSESESETAGDQAETQPEAGAGSLQVNSPAQGTEIPAGPVTFSGTGEPGSQVVIVAGGNDIGQADVDDEGNWQVDVNVIPGDTEIEVQMLDADGETTATAPPVVIVVTEPVDDAAGDETTTEGQEPAGETAQEPVTPTIDLPSANVYAYSLTLTGTGQPNSEVQIIANDIALSQTAVNDEGSWTANVNLVAGSYNIDVASLDESGEIVEQVPGLSLPVLPLPGPRLKLPDPEVDEFNPLLGLFLLRGVAEPGSEVGIVAGDDLLGSAVAGDNGRWEFETDLDEGSYDLTVGELDQSGTIAEPSDPISIEISDQPPTLELPDGSIEESDSGEPAVTMAAGLFALSGQAEPNSQVAIIIDKEVNVTVVADENGAWSAEGEIDEGDHELQLGVVDEGGAITSLSEPLPVNVSPSPEPVLDPVELDTATGDATVTGTTSADTEVNLIINGAVLTSTTSDETGRFTFEIRLGKGTYEIQVETVDGDGNVLFSSDVETVEVPAKESAGSDEAASEAGQGTAGEGEEADVISAADVQGNFSTLIAGLESAGLTETLQNVEQAHTLTAPTDDAFSALPVEVINAWDQNPESYAEILFYLVLQGRYTAEEMLQAQVLTTISGINIGITTDGENTLINGVPIQESIPAGNSIVHAIEQVILPPLGLETQPPIINESGVPIFTGTYLTVVGTAEPGKQILLTVSGENFGEIVIVEDDGSWQVPDNISSGVHDIIAYMLDDNGTLMAISQVVSLPVQ